MALQNTCMAKLSNRQQTVHHNNNRGLPFTRVHAKHNHTDAAELLLLARLVDRVRLNEAMSHTRITGLPPCQVLVMMNHLSARLCNPVMEAVDLVNKGRIEKEQAVAALRTVWECRAATLGEALSTASNKDAIHKAAKVANLLLKAGLISQQQLEPALLASERQALPAGQVLVQMGVLSNTLLFATLIAQELIREKTITEAQAVQAIKSAHFQRMRIDKVLGIQTSAESGTSKSLMLGELLVLSHILTEQVLMHALEMSQIKEIRLGEELVEGGHISERVLNAALRVQEMFRLDTLTLIEATEVLTIIQTTSHVSFEQALAVLDLPLVDRVCPVSYLELISAAGYATCKQLKPFEESAIQEDVRQTAMRLYQHGITSDRQLFDSLRCYSLMYRSALDVDQAREILHYCEQHAVHVDTALTALGLKTAN